jgi:beta-lactamase superfamily II metal-dependent hydrolase
MSYEIDFLTVGESNGDAICIRYGSQAVGFTIHVVDGGYKDTGQIIIDHLTNHYGNPERIDHVVLSHQDGDHISGLLPVMRHFQVGALWMNRPWLYAGEMLDAFHGNYTVDGLRNSIRDSYPLLAELEGIALEKGIPVYEAFAGTQIGAFTVLAPSRPRYLTLIPEFDRTPTSYAKPVKGVFGKIMEVAKSLVRFFETWSDEALQENPAPTTPANECSVVQLGRIDGQSILLTADAGPKALSEAADFASERGILYPPNFVQVPHHGSRRNVTPSILNRWLGNPLAEGEARKGVAFCSVGTNKPEYPRNRVANAFLRRGYPVFKVEPGGDWISHWHQMPQRSNARAIDAIPFTSSYEE